MTAIAGLNGLRIANHGTPPNAMSHFVCPDCWDQPTGLHQPFQVLLKKSRIFNRPLSTWLEPGETHTRSYVAFLFKIPANYQGVAQLVYKDGAITLKERGAAPKPRELTMNGVRWE